MNYPLPLISRRASLADAPPSAIPKQGSNCDGAGGEKLRTPTPTTKHPASTPEAPPSTDVPIIPIQAAGPGQLRRPRQLPVSRFLTDEAWNAIAASFGLSPREYQVLRAVFADKKESAIAEELGISEHTVHSHVRHIHHKLNAVDKMQLALRVMNEFVALTIFPGSTLSPICSVHDCGDCPLQGKTIAGM